MSTHQHTVASMRYQSDIRQIAGLLMVTGICGIFQPLADVTSIIDGGSGDTPTADIPFWLLIGGLCIISIGAIAVFIGYNQLVHDWGNKNLTGFLIVWLQTAYITYITLMTDIGQNAKTGAAFIPAEYGPSESDVHFVGAMGILAVMSYAFTFVGSIAFFLFSLYAYQNGKPEDRNAGYYRGRMGFYCGMLFLSGLGQLLLGSYVIANFGGGSMEFGPIGVAVYVVSFPAINCFIGTIQIMNGLWGLARSLRVGVFGPNDKYFQISMYTGWFLQMVLQVIVQIGYLPGATLSQAAATVFALSFSLNMMPAYLDYKMRSVPEVIDQDYYAMAMPDEVLNENVLEQDDGKEVAVKDIEQDAGSSGDKDQD